MAMPIANTRMSASDASSHAVALGTTQKVLDPEWPPPSAWFSFAPTFASESEFFQ